MSRNRSVVRRRWPWAVLGLVSLGVALTLGLRLIGGRGAPATGDRTMTVQRVVDGDTVKLAEPSGGTVTVRVLGIVH